MREENQLKNICNIIERYHAERSRSELNEPLHRYLKEYYRQHHAMGSRDRRQASEMIYNYFRVGKSLNELRTAERIAVAGFICSSVSNPLLSFCIDKYTLLKDSDVVLPMDEKIALLKNNYSFFSPDKIFPFAKYISERIDKKKFLRSLLIQPNLWIRIRRKYIDEVLNELKEKNISFEGDKNNPLTLSFANATALTNFSSYEKGYFEIQDWSSQQTQNYFHPRPDEHWWDACAGSGGKSMLLYEKENTVNIFATDIRASVIKNLEERFRKAGIENFQTQLIDVSTSSLKSEIQNIIADVPCSGSGTWSRSPEWLTMFDEKKIEEYQALQKNIITNLTQHLQEGGKLIYITCSVFKKENEDVVEFALANSSLTLLETAYINGSEKGADTMFAASFINQK